jgi:single-stranded-DNA-specific exonuclease
MVFYMLKQNEIAKEKVWITNAPDTAEANSAVAAISRALNVNPIIAKLLYNRGYQDPTSAASFVKMENEMLRNPFDMADMMKGVERIKKALDRKEKITVYGDYDVDGVTSVCTLYLYLKSLGANVEYYIPNRSGEGYGVSVSAIDSIKDGGTKLIITVDTGITANDEVTYAKSVGVDFLITDHHECRLDLPEACAVINPHRPDCKYPFKELAGVGVVFKLICAYEEFRSGDTRMKSTLRIIKEYADLVAIGTIADVMPIKEENRIIVKYGLNMIENTNRVGLAALIDVSSNKQDSRHNDRFDRNKRKRKTKITSSFIGFTLAPRINAAGRVRSATIAVELFLSDKYSDAIKIAEQLCSANKERQAEENKIMQEAYDKIEKLDIRKNPVIVLNADDWHHGVIGIVSSRITEKYSRPSILVSFDGNDEDGEILENVGKGSGRSIKGMNLVDALCYCSEHLVKFGGHELVAGLSVTREQLPLFIEKINEFARANLSEEDMVPVIEADCEIKFADASLALADSLQLLEPYGVANPVPQFIMRSVSVAEVSGVSDNKHTRLTLTDGKTSLSAMYFSNSPADLGVCAGDKVDILFNIGINEWQDRKSVQLIIRDIKVAMSSESQYKFNRQKFEDIKAGAIFTQADGYFPEREDFVTAYKFLQNSLHVGVDTFTHKELLSKLSTGGSNEIGYVKLKFIIMIFKEMNILQIDEFEDEKYRFKLHYSTTKKNLSKSSILKKLRSQMR